MNKSNIITTTLCSLLSANAIAQQRPNIILFLVDDMGWQDTSVPFHKERTPLNERYHTPNMERLANKGMKFTNAYACSISSPTRCSLFTGSNQARHRVTNWTLNFNSSVDAPDKEIAMPDWNVNGIQTTSNVPHSYRCTPFTQILRDNGYHTIHCGKAHFGANDTPTSNPLNIGFDVNIAGHAAGGPACYYGKQRFGHDKTGKPISSFAIPGLENYWDKDIFLTEALTLEAIKELKKARKLDKPFFLYMSHYAVHVPIQPDPRFIQKYLDKGLSKTEAAYATLVEGMDKSLGDLMDFLEKTNQIDNTIIVFMSDNGGLAAHARTAPLHIQNAPLKEGKGSAYEGGVREPMIVYWKNVVKPGTETDHKVIIEDFFPSLLDMAEITEYNTYQKIDGESFVPFLRGEDKSERKKPLIWNTPNNWIGGNNIQWGIGQTCAIREGDYKLIYFYKTGHKELYNLKEDIGEKKNLCTLMPQKTKNLSIKLGQMLREMNAQRPTIKATGKPCLWPDEVGIKSPIQHFE